jgi:hypothetical protein
MEFARYLRVPSEVQEELKKQYGSKIAADDDE